MVAITSPLASVTDPVPSVLFTFTSPATVTDTSDFTVVMVVPCSPVTVDPAAVAATSTVATAAPLVRATLALEAFTATVVTLALSSSTLAVLLTSTVPTVASLTTTGASPSTATLATLPWTVTVSVPPITATSATELALSATMRTGPAILDTSTWLLSLLMKWMELTPPPRTTTRPSMVTFSKNTSPSPTPSPMITSPWTVVSFTVTPGTLIITALPPSSVTVPAVLM